MEFINHVKNNHYDKVNEYITEHGDDEKKLFVMDKMSRNVFHYAKNKTMVVV